jgi:hypothetical protein
MGHSPIVEIDYKTRDRRFFSDHKPLIQLCATILAKGQDLHVVTEESEYCFFQLPFPFVECVTSVIREPIAHESVTLRFPNGHPQGSNRRVVSCLKYEDGVAELLNTLQYRLGRGRPVQPISVQFSQTEPILIVSLTHSLGWWRFLATLYGASLEEVAAPFIAANRIVLDRCSGTPRNLVDSVYLNAFLELQIPTLGL